MDDNWEKLEIIPDFKLLNHVLAIPVRVDGNTLHQMAST